MTVLPLLIAILLLTPTPICAEENRLNGRVMDAEQEVSLPYAKVMIKDVRGNTIAEKTTDLIGRFSVGTDDALLLSSTKNGKIDVVVTAESEGYLPYTRMIREYQGGQRDLSFRLQSKVQGSPCQQFPEIVRLRSPNGRTLFIKGQKLPPHNFAPSIDVQIANNMRININQRLQKLGIYPDPASIPVEILPNEINALNSPSRWLGVCLNALALAQQATDVPKSAKAQASVRIRFDYIIIPSVLAFDPPVIEIADKTVMNGTFETWSVSTVLAMCVLEARDALEAGEPLSKQGLTRVSIYLHAVKKDLAKDQEVLYNALDDLTHQVDERLRN